MVRCAIVGCDSRTLKTKQRDRSFFKVPRVRVRECDRTKDLSERRRRKWIARINRLGIELNPDRYSVCSRHFRTGHPAHLFDEGNPDWVPNQHLGYTLEEVDEEEYNRQKSPLQLVTHNRAGFGNLDGDDPAPSTAEPSNSHAVKQSCPKAVAACQTVMTGSHIDSLEERIATLKQKLGKKTLLLSRTTLTTSVSHAGTSFVAKGGVKAVPADVRCSREVSCCQMTQASITTATTSTQCALRFVVSAGSQTEFRVLRVDDPLADAVSKMFPTSQDVTGTRESHRHLLSVL